MPDLFQLERIGNKRSNIKWKQEQKDKIAELYLNKVSIRKIGEMFGGLHYNTIKKILQEYSIQLRTPSQSHFQDNRNENYFSTIDNEDKAYWLGFLAADGCVHGHYCILTLQKKDREQIEKFRDTLGITTIQIRDYSQITRTGKKCDYSTLSIGCKQLTDDLKKHGVIERKSLILQPPQISDDFIYDWIRGYFDGDGSISYSQKNNRWQCNCISTKEILEWMQEKLNIQNTKPFQAKRKESNEKCWTLHWNGRLNCLSTMNLIYKNNTAKIYLTRKHLLYEQLLSTLQQ